MIIKKGFIFIFLVTTSSISAHDLVHQSGDNVSTVCGNSYGPISLNERSISEWWNLFEDVNPDLVDVFELPESTLQIDIDNNYICSIYAELGIDKTCGEVDYFMIAAQGAAEYCSQNHGGVPVFLGPNSFTQATTQNSFDSHHQDYYINQGIVFLCQTDCYITNEVIQ